VFLRGAEVVISTKRFSGGGTKEKVARKSGGSGEAVVTNESCLGLLWGGGSPKSVQMGGKLLGTISGSKQWPVKQGLGDNGQLKGPKRTHPLKQHSTLKSKRNFFNIYWANVGI